MQPIYTLANCEAAYQLRWSLALFPKTPMPPIESWLTQLNEATTPDGIHVLDGLLTSKGSVLLLLSSQPQTSPVLIVQRVKGRLQNLLRAAWQPHWNRNFRLTTVGDVRSQAVEQYVQKQFTHHEVSTDIQQQLEDVQWRDDSVSIEHPIYSSHGQYVLGLHVVLQHDERWRCTARCFLEQTKRGMLATAAKYRFSISQMSILADHVHATLKFHYEYSPGQLAIAMMNNVAYCHGMLRLWSQSYYVGTIGPYDMGAVRGKR